MIIAFSLFIHHFIICGRWIDIADILHHEIAEVSLLIAGFLLIYIAKKTVIKTRNWVFSYWVTFLRHVPFHIGAWQLDILVSPLIWRYRNRWFHFWFTKIRVWDAYALFFWTLALGFFVPDIIWIIRKIYKWLQQYLSD